MTCASDIKTMSEWKHFFLRNDCVQLLKTCWSHRSHRLVWAGDISLCLIMSFFWVIPLIYIPNLFSVGFLIQMLYPYLPGPFKYLREPIQIGTFHSFSILFVVLPYFFCGYLEGLSLGGSAGASSKTASHCTGRAWTSRCFFHEAN